jgi:hypothetical protein
MNKTRHCLIALPALGFLLLPGAARGGSCSDTAFFQFKACASEVVDEFYVAQAICTNISDREEREDCFAEATASRMEGRDLCGAQRDAREDLCEALGEDRYDPEFDPADFDDDFTNLTTPNPYRPLDIGFHWEYAGGDETIVVEVLDETKLIEGVTCIVVNDRVEIGGELVEDTDDWFAQNKNGDTYYCGEEVKDFESFDGDDPRLPELVAIDGSFKWGRDGDKGGIYIGASPTVDAVYRQEFSAGNAEDAVRVLSATYSFGSDPELDEFMPPDLAELLCSRSDCVVTGEFSPMHPSLDGFALKYYARGIGVFLEVVPVTGETVQLVDCNYDKRCADLPTP